MKKNKDNLEQEILQALETGKLKRVKNAKQEIVEAEKAARAYFKKDARINIRVSNADLNQLRRKAVQEGIPYQTLIASILHKYVSGSLIIK